VNAASFVIAARASPVKLLVTHSFHLPIEETTHRYSPSPTNLSLLTSQETLFKFVRWAHSLQSHIALRHARGTLKKLKVRAHHVQSDAQLLFSQVATKFYVFKVTITMKSTGAGYVTAVDSTLSPSTAKID